MQNWTRLKKAMPPEYPYLQVIEDKPKLSEQKVWIRGDRNNPGDPAPPHFVSVLSRARSEAIHAKARAVWNWQRRSRTPPTLLPRGSW